jgi:hypothetical protein
MDWFYWLFPPLMTAAPLAMVWWAERTLPPAPDTAFRRWGKILLPAFILTGIAVYLSALASLGRESAVTCALFYLYFPAWGLAIPLTIRPNPNAGENNLNRPERTASLQPRRHQSPITSAWWAAAWSIALLGSTALGIIALTNNAWLSPISYGSFIAFAVFSVWLTQRALPMGLEEPEPLGVSTDPTLQREYARFRNQRTWMLFLMFALAMPILFLGIGAAMLLAGNSANYGATVGIVGGAIGSLFGLIGAAIGIGADLKRKRLAEMLKRSEAEAAQ